MALNLPCLPTCGRFFGGDATKAARCAQPGGARPAFPGFRHCRCAVARGAAPADTWVRAVRAVRAVEARILVALADAPQPRALTRAEPRTCISCLRSPAPPQGSDRSGRVVRSRLGSERYSIGWDAAPKRSSTLRVICPAAGFMRGVRSAGALKSSSPQLHCIDPVANTSEPAVDR